MFNRRVVGVSLRAVCSVVGAGWAVVLLGLVLAGCNGTLDFGNSDANVETGDTNVDVSTNVDQTQNVAIDLGDSESPTAVVDVSPSKDVSRGQEVTLDASASTPGSGGGSLSYVWSEVTGFGIVIRDATAAVATAEIPLDIDDGDTIVIRVQVSAGQRADTTEVRLTVVGGSSEGVDACEGVSCPQGETCNPATGVCVDESANLCADVTCSHDQTCNPTTGLCDDNDLCAAVTCAAGETCGSQTGMCEPVGLCEGVTCPAGQTCDPDTGDCLSGPTVLYVEAGAPPGGDGTSWATALDDLQAALAEAVNLGGSLEIWVAGGTYTPAGPGGDRSASFNMLNNVELLGGFAGTETTRSQRNVDANETILSGDLDGDDEPGFIGNSFNSFHVVTASAVADTAVLDGFTVQNGNASGSTPDDGGGGLLVVNNGSPIIRGCLFRDNSASASGGAISGSPSLVEGCDFEGNQALSSSGAAHSSLSIFVDCLFSENHASNSGAVGSPCCSFNSSYVRCTFLNNSSDNNAGAGSLGDFINCRFLGNTAGTRGGALDFINIVRNCVFSGNQALDGNGGAITGTGSGIIVNSTFSNNTATGTTGGVNGVNEVRNCILWGNTDSTGATETAQLAFFSPAVAPTNTLIQGLSGFSGSGNISLNPRFVDPLGPDGIAGTLDDDLRLLSNSPTIDAGDNGSLDSDGFDLDGDGDTVERTPLDLDDTPRIKNGTVDMGAYEADQ